MFITVNIYFNMAHLQRGIIRPLCSPFSPSQTAPYDKSDVTSTDTSCTLVSFRPVERLPVSVTSRVLSLPQKCHTAGMNAYGCVTMSLSAHEATNAAGKTGPVVSRPHAEGLSSMSTMHSCKLLQGAALIQCTAAFLLPFLL